MIKNVYKAASNCFFLLRVLMATGSFSSTISMGGADGSGDESLFSKKVVGESDVGKGMVCSIGVDSNEKTGSLSME